MATDWKYSKAGRLSGPVTEEKVAAMVRNGELGPEDQVFHKKIGWQPVRDVVALLSQSRENAIDGNGESRAEPSADHVIRGVASNPPEPLVVPIHDMSTSIIASDSVSNALPKAPENASGGKCWKYSKNNTIIGPVSQDEIAARMRLGGLGPQDQVWRKDLGWQSVEKVRHLVLGGLANAESAPESDNWAGHPAPTPRSMAMTASKSMSDGSGSFRAAKPPLAPNTLSVSATTFPPSADRVPLVSILTSDTKSIARMSILTWNPLVILAVGLVGGVVLVTIFLAANRWLFIPSQPVDSTPISVSASTPTSTPLPPSKPLNLVKPNLPAAPGTGTAVFPAKLIATPLEANNAVANVAQLPGPAALPLAGSPTQAPQVASFTPLPMGRFLLFTLPASEESTISNEYLAHITGIAPFPDKKKFAVTATNMVDVDQLVGEVCRMNATTSESDVLLNVVVDRMTRTLSIRPVTNTSGLRNIEFLLLGPNKIRMILVNLVDPTETAHHVFDNRIEVVDDDLLTKLDQLNQLRGRVIDLEIQRKALADALAEPQLRLKGVVVQLNNAKARYLDETLTESQWQDKRDDLQASIETYQKQVNDLNHQISMDDDELATVNRRVAVLQDEIEKRRAALR